MSVKQGEEGQYEQEELVFVDPQSFEIEVTENNIVIYATIINSDSSAGHEVTVRFQHYSGGRKIRDNEETIFLGASTELDVEIPFSRSRTASSPLEVCFDVVEIVPTSGR